MPTYLLFDEDRLDELHRASLKVLEDTGVLVYHEGALAMLSDAGCPVDAAEKTARIPSALVKRRKLHNTLTSSK